MKKSKLNIIAENFTSSKRFEQNLNSLLDSQVIDYINENLITHYTYLSVYINKGSLSRYKLVLEIGDVVIYNGFNESHTYDEYTTFKQGSQTYNNWAKSTILGLTHRINEKVNELILLDS